MINYKEKIKLYREIKGITQVQLAEQLGVGVASVKRWETGKFEPSLTIKSELIKLFKAEGIYSI